MNNQVTSLAEAPATRHPKRRARRTGDKIQTWVEKLQPLMCNVLEAYIQLGQELKVAYQELGSDDYAKVLVGIGVSARYARALRATGKNETIAGRKHVSALPASVMTLELLAGMDADELEDAIANGDVTPQTTYREAQELTGHAVSGRQAKASKQPKKTSHESEPDTVIKSLRKAAATYDKLDEDNRKVVLETASNDAPVKRFFADVTTYQGGGYE